MAFEACINPHNGLFGSTTLLGMIRVDYASIKIPPQPVIADDASVAILMKSSHDAHTGMVTFNDLFYANAVAGQDGPQSFSFDCEASDGGTDVSHSFAGCEFGEVSGGIGTGQAGTWSVPFAAKALTVT